MISNNPIGSKKVYGTVEEEEVDFYATYGNQHVITENLEYTYSSAFHTCHEDLEMEEPEEGECDQTEGAGTTMKRAQQSNPIQQTSHHVREWE